MTVAVLLANPKFARNVGNTLRACALLGADRLFWTGYRVPGPDAWPPSERLPREERMRCYKRTPTSWLSDPTRPLDLITGRYTPVCVEISHSAESLEQFQHPANALYIFGPEDGDVPKGIRHECHRFVRIPNALPAGEPDARTPFNLSHAVALVLFHRLLQHRETSSTP